MIEDSVRLFEKVVTTIVSLVVCHSAVAISNTSFDLFQADKTEKVLAVMSSVKI